MRATTHRLVRTQSCACGVGGDAAVQTAVTPAQPQSREYFVDADEAASFLHIERRTVLRWARKGRIPAHPLDPDATRNVWRFLLSELDAWLRGNVNSACRPCRPHQERNSSMRKVSRRQLGSLKRVRKNRVEVWVFRWREIQTNGSLRPRKLVIGSTADYRSEAAARKRIEELRLNINLDRSVEAACPRSFAELVEHYRAKELSETDDPEGKAFSTKNTNRGYLRKWIESRWGAYALADIKAVAVEEWLHTLWLTPTKRLPKGKPAANGTKKKIRDLMHSIFQHAIRYEWIDRNPISSVRQSGKREAVPDVLEVEEVASLLDRLQLRERLAVFLDFGTGARRGELSGLKWEDIDFRSGTVLFARSIVHQRSGKVKTEASSKPMPLSPELLKALEQWRTETPYAKNGDYILASPAKKGRQPLWLSTVMRYYIVPAARDLGITKRIGWHTLRRTFACCVQDLSEDPKVVQELLRHASSFRVAMDIYAQAMMKKKRKAQSDVVALLGSVRNGDGNLGATPNQRSTH
jgi:excisionase family DNA binding protein